MNPSKYVEKAVRIGKEYVAKKLTKGYKLPKKADNPCENGYFPKWDVSQILVPDEASYYQSLIGVLRWMIEIG